MYRIMFKTIIYPIIIKVNLSYIKFLKNEQRKAQEYVDRLNEERNFMLERDRDYNVSYSFRNQWFEYEDEYDYNFCGLE
jgi:hypothetical protein